MTDVKIEVLLAKPWPTDLDPTGWWMSEKLDGVRAYWTGSEFVSRLGNIFHAPEWFTTNLPAHALDGELFGGRKNFQSTISTVRKLEPVDEEWKQIQYLAFDAPEHPGTFEERMMVVRRCGTLSLPVTHVRCEGFEHLRERLALVESLGGEGLMLRKPGSLYERKRSSTLLKVKTFHDAEATVTGHEPGKGKHKGRLGALVCDFGGTAFSVGTGFTDAERESPPPVGTRVTFRYQELTRDGVPRFPSFVRTYTAV